MIYTKIGMFEAFYLEQLEKIKIYATKNSGMPVQWQEATYELNKQQPNLTEIECIRSINCEYLIEFKTTLEQGVSWKFAYGKKI